MFPKRFMLALLGPAPCNTPGRLSFDRSPINHIRGGILNRRETECRHM